MKPRGIAPAHYPLAREQSLSFSGHVYWSESGLHRHLYTLNSIEISVRTRYQRNYVLLTVGSYGTRNMESNNGAVEQ